MNPLGTAAISGCFTAVLAAGCALVSMPPLDSDVPGDWGEHAAESGGWPVLEWWKDFGSDELIALMEQVREHNLDLQTSERNLRQAQIAMTDASFDLFGVPRADLSTGASWAGSKAANGEFADSAAEVGTDLSVSSVISDVLHMPARHQSILIEYESAVATRASIRLSTFVTAASAYFRVLLSRDQIQAARSNLQRAEAIARITQARVNAGVLTPIDALQQEIQVQQQRYALAQLRHQEFAARAALAALMAESGRDFAVRATTLEGLRTPRIAPGMPSDLLRRRPDIVQAELNLRQARANVTMARNALFPRISLTSSVRRSSDALRDLVSAGSLSVSVASSLVQTVFDFGRRGRANETARLEMETALANYRQTVIRAFSDIDVILGAIELLESQEKLLREQLTNAEETLRIAEVRYREGVIDYLSLLTAQQSLYSARNAMLGNKSSYINAILDLYQALGGGWSATIRERIGRANIEHGADVRALAAAAPRQPRTVCLF